MAGYWGFVYYEGEVNDPAIFVFLVPCLLWALRFWATSFKFRWALLAGLMFWMAGEVRLGAYAVGGFGVAIVVFAALARLAVRLLGTVRGAGRFGWRQGLASEIVGALLQMALERLGLPDLVGFALPENRPSIRILEKLGFGYEKDVEYAGKRHVLYRLTLERFAALRRTGGFACRLLLTSA